MLQGPSATLCVLVTKATGGYDPLIGFFSAQNLVVEEDHVPTAAGLLLRNKVSAPMETSVSKAIACQ